MDIINLAVIGCGRIGKMHVDNIICDFPNVAIKAIVDDNVDPDWIQHHKLKAYAKNELDQVLSTPEINTVLIAASSQEHLNLIKKAAQYGKHIFCEKPIAFTPEEVQEAIDVVEKAGVKLQVGFNRRFDPEFKQVKKTLVEGKIGKPHIIKVTNRDPKRPDLNFIPRSGGLFLDFNVHDFDMIRYLTNDEVDEIFAMGVSLVDPKIAELNDVDTAIITVKMKQGTICIIDVSREALYGYDQRLEVFASEGCIMAPNISDTNTELATEQGVKKEKPLYSFVERYAQAYRDQFREFFDYIQSDNKPSPVDANDAKKAVGMAIAAKESMEKNRPIKL